MANDAGLIKESFRLFRRRPVLYFAVAAVPFVGVFFIRQSVNVTISFALPALAHGRSFEWVATVLAVKNMFLLIITAVGHAVAGSGIAMLTWEECEGRSLPALKLAAATARRLLPLLALGLIIGIGAVAGTLLLILPGLAFLVLTAFAVPAAMIENLGPLRALKRSFRLTRGRVLKLMVVFVLVILAVAGLKLPLALVPQKSLVALMTVEFLLLAIQITFDMFLCTLLTLLYRQARTEREGAQPA